MNTPPSSEPGQPKNIPPVDPADQNQEMPMVKGAEILSETEKTRMQAFDKLKAKELLMETNPPENPKEKADFELEKKSFLKGIYAGELMNNDSLRGMLMNLGSDMKNLPGAKSGRDKSEVVGAERTAWQLAEDNLATLTGTLKDKKTSSLSAIRDLKDFTRASDIEKIQTAAKEEKFQGLESLKLSPGTLPLLIEDLKKVKSQHEKSKLVEKIAVAERVAKTIIKVRGDLKIPVKKQQSEAEVVPLERTKTETSPEEMPVVKGLMTETPDVAKKRRQVDAAKRELMDELNIRAKMWKLKPSEGSKLAAKQQAQRAILESFKEIAQKFEQKKKWQEGQKEAAFKAAFDELAEEVKSKWGESKANEEIMTIEDSDIIGPLEPSENEKQEAIDRELQAFARNIKMKWGEKKPVEVEDSDIIGPIEPTEAEKKAAIKEAVKDLGRDIRIMKKKTGGVGAKNTDKESTDEEDEKGGLFKRVRKTIDDIFGGKKAA